jgi:hypothetical protein
MVIKKCEKCDLNYVKEGEKYCKVCLKTMKGNNEKSSKVELCPSCGERIVAKGHELCKVCLSDMMDTVEKFEDDNGDALEQDITPVAMDMSSINISEDDNNDIIPDDIKNDIDDQDNYNDRR